MKREFVVAIGLIVLLTLTAKFVSRNPEHSADVRRLASGGNAFHESLSRFGVNVYFANLHAHHFMGYAGVEDVVIAPGPCASKARFFLDDGKPCRTDENGVNSNVPVEGGTIEYFRLACQYAKEIGGLDILFVTPHSKIGAENSDTDTPLDGFSERHQILRSINEGFSGNFYCGLGQEASSISKGNHINILGHFPESSQVTRPYYFPAGEFAGFYSEIGRRSSEGERVVLQLNHPDVKRDLWWGAGAQNKKEHLNDYGLDDFAPVACIKKKGNERPPECAGNPIQEISNAALKDTFRRLREVSNDRFRLIEIVSPQGAAENSETAFKPVHDHEGIFDYIFYLAMGFKVAPTANQDNHYINYGDATASRTGILAVSLNESDVFAALDSRRTYATEDRNAKVLFFSGENLMGDSFVVSDDHVDLSVGYSDPDSHDGEANVRLYYYRDDEELDFHFKANREKTRRILEFQERLIVRSDEVLTVPVRLNRGGQYVFVELMQADGDRIWSAPLWVDYK